MSEPKPASWTLTVGWPDLPLAEAEGLPGRVLVAAIAFLVITGLALLVMARLGRAGGTGGKDCVPAAAALQRIVGYGGAGLAALVAWAYAAGDPTPLVLAAAVVVVMTALTYNPLVADLAGALVLLLGRPFRPGDWIAAGGCEGRVRSLGALWVEIETADGGVSILPNRRLLEGGVTRKAPAGAGVPLTLRFTVPPAAEPELVLGLLERAAGEVPEVSAGEAPLAALEAIGGDGLELSLRVVVTAGGEPGEAATRVRIAVLKALRRAGIALPRTERHLYLRDLDGLRQALAAALAERRRRQEAEAGGDGGAGPPSRG